MDELIIKRWENGKENLRKWFETTPQCNYDNYQSIVSALIKYCLNFGDCEIRISEEFDVLDHGDYQGTQIFILHENEYQPSSYNYYVFDNYYGSCSGCDTLLGISRYDVGFPTKEQVDGYMTLCLHMVQRMKRLGDLWNN